MNAHVPAGFGPVADGVEVHAVSPGLAPETVGLCVCVPTFRRPDRLVATLESLAVQVGAPAFAVIIMENDIGAGDGARASAAWLETAPIKGMVVTVRDPGNCNAYNGGLAAAVRHFPGLRHVAIIDDDERAEPAWLATLLAAAERHGADCVGGPQVAVFPDGTANALKRHPVFAPAHRQSGPVAMLHSSGNVLLSRAVLEAFDWQPFDPAFNFTGGGDSDFYRRAAAAGFRFAWAENARVLEDVPPRRLEADWLRARSLRNGALSTIIERRARTDGRSGIGRFAGELATLGHSLALLGAAPLRALVDLARTGNRHVALYRIEIAIGRMLGHAGRINEQYRAPHRN